MKRALLYGLVVVILLGAGCAPGGEGRSLAPSWMKEMKSEIGEFGGTIFSQQQVGIWVTGEGKAIAVPDVAMLRLGVEAQAKTVAEAQRRAAETMDRVVKALKANGVKDKDIQTQRFSIYPVRRWLKGEEKEEIIGYRVTNIVTAKIREVDKAGVIIDAVAEAGGDLTRIEDIGFTVDDPKPYYEEAREKAVKEAMSKAGQIAKVAGVKLGKPIYISEVAAYIPSPVKVLAERAAAPEPSPTPISPGELEIRLTVQMVYEID